MNANNHLEIDNVIKTIIKNQNPWHDPVNKDWYLKDGALRELMDADAEDLYESFFYLISCPFFDFR